VGQEWLGHAGALDDATAEAVHVTGSLLKPSLGVEVSVASRVPASARGHSIYQDG